MTVERHPTKPGELHPLRKLHVTASRVGALPLINCHPYCTPLKLYLEKRGVEFPEPTSSVLRRGKWLEPAVQAALAEQNPEWEVEPINAYYCYPKLRLGATPDVGITGDPRGFGIGQIKTVAPNVWESKWDNGREVPFWISLQLLTELTLTDAAFGVIAALVVDPYDMQLHVINVERHPAAETKIKNAVAAFWADVEAGREPQPDFATDTEAIRALAGQPLNGQVFDATSHNMLPEMLAQRADLKALIKDYEMRCEEIENEIKYMMREAEKVDGLPGWHITFKTQNRAGYSVPPKTLRVLRITDRRPEHEQPQS